jgi:hypothetical protein
LVSPLYRKLLVLAREPLCHGLWNCSLPVDLDRVSSGGVLSKGGGDNPEYQGDGDAVNTFSIDEPRSGHQFPEQGSIPLLRE